MTEDLKAHTEALVSEQTPSWRILNVPLPSGIHAIDIQGTIRSSYNSVKNNGVRLDDIILKPCKELGKINPTS